MAPPPADDAATRVAQTEPVVPVMPDATADEPPPAGQNSGEPILEPTVVLGAMSVAAVQSVLQSAKRELDACYTAELANHPALAGKVLVRFSIGTDGKVASVRTKSTSLWHPPTEECLNTKLATLQFPKPGEGGTALVTHPFTFPN